MVNIMEIISVKIQGNGWLLNGKMSVPNASGNREREAIMSWIAEGNTPEPEFTDAEILSKSITRLESTTDAYIQSKIDVYNLANGVKFKNIDSFSKYAVNTASQHNAIANQFIAYADNIWKTVRAYQSVAITIPTDEEFKVILDGVAF
jgi:hypothetical protein